MTIDISKKTGETCQITIGHDCIDGVVYEANQEDCHSVHYVKRGNGRDIEEFLLKVEGSTGIKFYTS